MEAVIVVLKDIEASLVEQWLQALTTLELAEAHFSLDRTPVVDLFRARELAARLALGLGQCCLH